VRPAKISAARASNIAARRSVAPFLNSPISLSLSAKSRWNRRCARSNFAGSAIYPPLTTPPPPNRRRLRVRTLVANNHPQRAAGGRRGVLEGEPKVHVLVRDDAIEAQLRRADGTAAGVVEDDALEEALGRDAFELGGG
jgi:hypothetical protein